ncbi:MFS transporter [Phaeacidiphilus oryzae]|uniref:MFS transporter n=1 Tax=Phaeacidiphilus oryzae TaxID=348818 RepID=UPI00068B4583|nr:MFS transporter [Phaeacidiphilus oryzae]
MPETIDPPRDVSSGQRGLGVGPMLGSMAVVEVVSGFTQQYLYPVLPTVGSQHGISVVQLSWIYVVQQVGMTVFTPVLSRLGDNHGYRKVLRLSVAMVAFGSLLMAVWPSLGGIALGALLQGGVVGFMPLMIGILRDRAGDAGVRRGIGALAGVLLAAVGVAGVAAGAVAAVSPVLGLWAGAVVGVLGFTACLLIPAERSEPVGQGFPLLPCALLSVGLIGITLALSQGPAWGWASSATLISAAIGVLAAAAWPFAELRAERPMVDVRMFRNRRVALLSVVTFCLSFGTLGTLGANSTFLGASPHTAGYGFGLGSLATGFALLPLSATGMAASLLTPRALRLLGDRVTVAIGGLAALVGFGGLALLYRTLTGWVVTSALVGIAMGVFESATRALSVEAVPTSETATAAGVNELVLSLGGAVGAALVSATLSAHADAADRVELGGYSTAWVICGLVGAAAAVAAGWLPRKTN